MCEIPCSEISFFPHSTHDVICSCSVVTPPAPVSQFHCGLSLTSVFSVLPSLMDLENICYSNCADSGELSFEPRKSWLWTLVVFDLWFSSTLVPYLLLFLVPKWRNKWSYLVHLYLLSFFLNLTFPNQITCNSKREWCITKYCTQFKWRMWNYLAGWKLCDA